MNASVDASGIDLTCLDEKDLAKLRASSPLYSLDRIANAKVKVLIGLGGKDVRVPSMQARTTDLMLVVLIQ